MKIKVEAWITDEYENKSFKIKEIHKCCDQLINSKNININAEYCEDEHYCGDNTYSVKLIRKEEEGIPWEDYTETNFYYEKIDFCPFCGEIIEIEFISNVVDKQEELESLRKEREEIWSKCRKTDSKKKEHELQQRVHELDNEINEIHMNDDFTKEEV